VLLNYKEIIQNINDLIEKSDKHQKRKETLKFNADIEKKLFSKKKQKTR